MTEANRPHPVSSSALTRIGPAHADGRPRAEFVVRSEDRPTQANLQQAIDAYKAVGRQKHATQSFDSGTSVNLAGSRQATLVIGRYRAGDKPTGATILTYDLFAISNGGQPFHLYAEGTKSDLGAEFASTFVLTTRVG
jgi:hypothetical protein